MPLTVAELAPIYTRDPYLHSVLKKVVEEINLTQKQTGVAGSSALGPPPTLGSISVVAAGGFFDIALQDNTSNLQRGIVYFAEWATDVSFANAHVVPMSSSRNAHVGLGNLTTFWRGYSMYVGSTERSAFVYFGGAANPTAVVGGGAAGPAPQQTQGSGTSQLPGYGFGAKSPIVRRVP